MLARPFSPAERMSDVFDRAATLNFTTVATVRGALSKEKLEAALRRLERRHPLLTARIERDSETWTLNPGEAAPIPLVVRDGTVDAVQPLLEASLCHRVWQDAGPRAELTWLRHAPDHSSLLLCLHHTVSDGSSGILAMRDLLELVDHARDVEVAELPAPAQDDFFPPLQRELRARVMESLKQSAPAASAPPPVPYRLRSPVDVPLEERRAKNVRIRLAREESQRLVENARRLGLTLHGFLCASFSLALAQESDATPLQRFAHPVSLRRYLKERFPAQPEIGDAIGYYVSNVQTDHTVDAARDAVELAREMSLAVQAQKDAHEPLISAPIRGPLLAQRAEKMGLDAFRTWAEQKVFLATCAISNLGDLSRLGAKARVGALEVEDFYFAMASSIMGAFSASAVSFRERLSLNVSYVEPLVSRQVAERVVERTREQLSAFAASPVLAQ